MLVFLLSLYQSTCWSHTITFPTEPVIKPVLVCLAFTIQASPHQASSGFITTFYPSNTQTYTHTFSHVLITVSCPAGAMDVEERTRQMKLKVEKYKQGAGSDSRLEQDHRSKASHWIFHLYVHTHGSTTCSAARSCRYSISQSFGRSTMHEIMYIQVKSFS